MIDPFAFKRRVLALVFVMSSITACSSQDESAWGQPDQQVPDAGEVDIEPEPSPVIQLTWERRPTTLTELAEQAVARVPDWLRADLVDLLDRLDEDTQDIYAALITDIEDPRWIDEVAFSVAHTSPEVLGYRYFYPELLLDNARDLYLVASQVRYVELVDVGDPIGDEDFYTTARYLVRNEDGALVEQEVPRDIYYWYVVHPRLEDELPFFIDAYRPCSAGSLQCPRSPEQGEFWRGFLFTVKDSNGCPTIGECPVLADLLAEAEVLWSYDGEGLVGNGAVGQVTRWVLDVMDFGAGAERSIQPNRIYGLHHGNCGEFADITSAAGRTALIPMINVGASANDHTWNEFWEGGRWRQLEPIGQSVDYHGYYVDQNGDYYRQRNRRDDDCDGLADDGANPGDGDGDGISVQAGDCDDTDPLSFPGAPEDEDGRDNDCDGVADTGLDDSDADEDGWSIAEGDCDDGDPARNPDAEDTPPSNNRLYATSVVRGDAMVWLRTEDYASPFILEVHVSDVHGDPVDGAVVSIYGPFTVYPEYADRLVYAAEGYTGLDGSASLLLGEANDYYGRVDTPIGSDPPEENYVHSIVSWPHRGDREVWEVTIQGEIPPGLAVQEVDSLGDGPADLRVSFRHAVPEYLLHADSLMVLGTFSNRLPSGILDRFITDAQGYQAFLSGLPFQAVSVGRDLESGWVVTHLSSDRPWYLVLSNTRALASTMVGQVELTVESQEHGLWRPVQKMDAEVVIPPQEHAAFAIAGDFVFLF